MPIEDRVADLVSAVLDVRTAFALMILGYDAIEAQDVHTLMGWNLEYRPPQMHLYTVTQRVPPLPNLPRLRVRPQVLQVTWPEAATEDLTSLTSANSHVPNPPWDGSVWSRWSLCGLGTKLHSWIAR